MLQWQNKKIKVRHVIYSHPAGSIRINLEIAEEYKVYIHPATGTIASEWSVLFTWKPRMYFEVETIAKDSNCSQRVPSSDG